MARLRPGWLVVLCAAVLAVSVWLPWLTSRADGGGRANAIGGVVGNMSVPPPGFGVGQLIVLLASTLIVAGAMAARGLFGRLASAAALAISVAAGGADDVVLPALRVLTGVCRLRAVPRRRCCCVRGGAVGVGDGRRLVGGQSGFMSGFVEAVSLTGQRWVALEPLVREHIPEITEAAADGELGSLWFTSAPKAGAVEQWVEMRLASQKPDEGLTFVVRTLDGTLIGSSSYLNVDAANQRLEIGNTWYVASARRSGVNSETKLLMLGHAFDELGCVAVEFRTHFFNFTSRGAIERLGAKLDGVLRSHQVLPDGSRRDTVVYSILDIEWPAVRNNLNARLAAF